MAVFSSPSSSANPSRTSKNLPSSTARNSQKPAERSPSGPVMKYAERPPTNTSWRVNVAGHSTGPQNFSIWRGSVYASHNRSRVAEKSATTVIVSASRSFSTEVMGMGLPSPGLSGFTRRCRREVRRGDRCEISRSARTDRATPGHAGWREGCRGPSARDHGEPSPPRRWATINAALSSIVRSVESTVYHSSGSSSSSQPSVGSTASTSISSNRPPRARIRSRTTSPSARRMTGRVEPSVSNGAYCCSK